MIQAIAAVVIMSVLAVVLYAMLTAGKREPYPYPDRD